MSILNKTLGFWARKVLHLTLNGAIAAAALLLPPASIRPITVVGFIAVLVFESVRLKTRARRYVEQAVGPLFKKEEGKEYSGLFWAGIGALIIAQFAQAPAFSYAFAVLAVSDASAAAAGHLWGRRPFYMKKTVPGSVAFFVACCLVSYIYASVYALPLPPLVFSLFMAVLVTVLEIFSYPFDDNFLILVFTGYALHWILG